MKWRNKFYRWRYLLFLKREPPIPHRNVKHSAEFLCGCRFGYSDELFSIKILDVWWHVVIYHHDAFMFRRCWQEPNDFMTTPDSVVHKIETLLKETKK